MSVRNALLYPFREKSSRCFACEKRRIVRRNRRKRGDRSVFKSNRVGDFVVFDVFFYILDGGVDRRLVHFFRRDAIIERETRFGRDLRHHADRILRARGTRVRSNG